MNRIIKTPGIRTAILLSVFLACFRCAAQDSYDDLTKSAHRLFRQGKLDEAKQAAQQAIREDTNRFEAYVITADIAAKQGAASEAQALLKKALALAPDEDSKARIRELAASLQQAGAPSQSTSAASLSDEDRLALNVLNLLLDKTDKATTPEERAQLCQEILTRSGSFLRRHPEQAHVWVIRGVAAVVLLRAHEAWEAGQHLKALGMMHSDDPDVSKLLAELDLKGWLNREPRSPQPSQRWVNSLGQIFVPVPGTSVLFCVWDTRVQDFQAFVNETGYDATGDMLSLGRDGWKKRGDTWKSPGFFQGATHPVCGVSWDDAHAFCRWLTDKERGKGLLTENQSYRLPTDAEWSIAVGGDKYPWGNQWPPPAGAGNYAGSEAANENWPDKRPTMSGYHDAYARTSPVGSFPANRLGLFDIGGNVWQWCEDWYRKDMNSADTIQKDVPVAFPGRDPRDFDDDRGYSKRVLRGAGSLDGPYPEIVSSECRLPLVPSERAENKGFRCVLVPGGAVR